MIEEPKEEANNKAEKRTVLKLLKKNGFPEIKIKKIESFTEDEPKIRKIESFSPEERLPDIRQTESIVHDENYSTKKSIFYAERDD